MWLQIAGFPSFYFFLFIYLYLLIYVIFFISSVDKHLGCFHIMALVNNAARKIGVKMTLENPKVGMLTLDTVFKVAESHSPRSKSIFLSWYFPYYF